MLIDSLEVLTLVAHNAEINEHKYGCYKVVVCFQGTFTCTLNHQTLQQVTGFVLASNVQHACYAPNTSVLVYMVEIQSRLGQAIRILLKERPYLNITAQLSTLSLRQLLNQGKQALRDHTMPDLANQVILALFPTLLTLPAKQLDSRVQQIMTYIDTHLHQTIHLPDLANLVNLSPGRTRDIFKREITTPFTQYVLWKRIKAVIQVVVTEKMELGTAALTFGFADQPHFNRVFKGMFGSNPAYLLKKNHNLLLLTPPG